MGGSAGLLKRAEPRPHRQGGTPCVRGVLLRECQEQLRDAELRRVSLFVISVCSCLVVACCRAMCMPVYRHVAIQMYSLRELRSSKYAGVRSAFGVVCFFAELRLQSRPYVPGKQAALWICFLRVGGKDVAQ